MRQNTAARVGRAACQPVVAKTVAIDAACGVIDPRVAEQLDRQRRSKRGHRVTDLVGTRRQERCNAVGRSGVQGKCWR